MGDAGSRLAWRASELLRDAGFGVVVNAGGGSFKSQMKRADATGAPLALLIGGADGAAASEVGVKRQTRASLRRAENHSARRTAGRARGKLKTRLGKAMAVYDLEEQDKLDDLKAWWAQWGTVITGAIIALCIGVIAVQGWRWWSQRQADQAAVLYNAVGTAARANDLAKAKDATAQLSAKYGGTGYAPRASLIVAAMEFENGDKAGAKAELTSVIDKSSEDELKQIARLRLAAILFDDKQYDEALRTLDAKHDEPFEGIYADLRGDILVGAGRNEEARKAYQTALATRRQESLPELRPGQARHDRRADCRAVRGSRNRTAQSGSNRTASSGRNSTATGGWNRVAHSGGNCTARNRTASGGRNCAASGRCNGTACGRVQIRALRHPMTEAIAQRLVAAVRPIAVVLAALALGGCSSLASWIPSIPPPSFDWFSSSKKPAPLPEFKPIASPRVAWQVPVGKATPGLAPAITSDAIYAASASGTIVKVNPTTGQTAWRIEAGKRLSAGVGADSTLVAVGTDKGEVLAFTPDGKPLWQSTVTSEIVSPPKVAEGIVVVWSGDGKVFGLSGADGKTKWVYQRSIPPLTVRNYSGGLISRGGLFVGTAGGKLLALDLSTGNVGWEGNVATPKGATELERIADVTSQPLVEERQACAVAYQGRVACFEILRGTLNWSRDLSSLEGLAVDERYIYVTDDKGAVHALDKTTGASAWKQDKLGPRKPSGPQLLGEHVAVVDVEGYVHLLDRNDGSLVGRIATDGAMATAQPTQSGANAVWQSTGGTLLAVGER